MKAYWQVSEIDAVSAPSRDWSALAKVVLVPCAMVCLLIAAWTVAGMSSSYVAPSSPAPTGSHHVSPTHYALISGNVRADFDAAWLSPSCSNGCTITLRRGTAMGHGLFQWRHQVNEGQIQQAQHNVTLVVYDGKNHAVAKYNISRAFPSTASWASGSDTAKGAVQQIVLQAASVSRG